MSNPAAAATGKFQQIDTNSDGIISRQEFDAAVSKGALSSPNDNFDNFDKDKNGMISSNEFSQNYVAPARDSGGR